MRSDSCNHLFADINLTRKIEVDEVTCFTLFAFNFLFSGRNFSRTDDLLTIGPTPKIII